MRDALAKAEKKVSLQLAKELAELPARFGYDDPSDLCVAITEAQANAKRSGGAKRKAAAPKVKKRGKVTPHAIATIKKHDGKRTAKELAKMTGLSKPTIAALRKRLGLVKPHKPGKPTT